MRTVPVLQALAWGGESPLRPSGEVDMAALGRGLARSNISGGARRKPYTRAQHAVAVSEAVEALVSLDEEERRVLAMHAWLAEVRNDELKDQARVGGAKKRVVIRTMDMEAMAEALARAGRWDGGRGDAGDVPGGAAAIDAFLKSLDALDAWERRRLSLYGLLAEAALAGLGTTVAEAALETAGLALKAPVRWVDALRFARRMAGAAVRRDLPGAGPDTYRAFPAAEARVVALEPGEAGERWLSRYRALTGPGEEDRS